MDACIDWKPLRRKCHRRLGCIASLGAGLESGLPSDGLEAGLESGLPSDGLEAGLESGLPRDGEGFAAQVAGSMSETRHAGWAIL